MACALCASVSLSRHLPERINVKTEQSFASSRSSKIVVRHRFQERNSYSAGNHSSQRRLRVSAAAGGKPEGDPTSKAVLDAFFLGRALADTINERLGSALGEFISEVNQRQAEQREATRQFQDEVKERAQSALEKAVQEALTDQSQNPPKSNSA